MKKMFRPLFTALLILTVACGDITSTTGDMGILSFSYFSDYEMGTVSLDNAALAAGVTHHLSVDIIQNKSSIDFSRTIYIADTEGVTVITDTEKCPEGHGSCVPGFSIKATKAGTVTINAYEGVHEGESFIDSIRLTFKEIAQIDPLVKVRGPWEEDFALIDSAGDVFTVEKGSQVVFLPVPLDSYGKRLLGNFDCAYNFDDETMVVPGENVDYVYEDRDEWGVGGPQNFYFIEEGEVALTVTEAESGFSSDFVFHVVPMEVE